MGRPYARTLAASNLCTHFTGGNPGDRLRRAGWTSYIRSENRGCRSGGPTSAVLGSHSGVWVAAGRVRLVVDFYHPR